MTYGGVVGLQLGGELVALVTDPEVAKFVLIDGSSLFLKVRHIATIVSQYWGFAQCLRI